MDGQAQAPESLSDLASFIGDTPETESPEVDEAETSDELTEEFDTSDEESDGQEESDDGSDEEMSDEEEADDTPAPERKVKVTVKGDDGTDQELEVDESELVKSYMRQSDYTRKTQELSQRESQAVELLTGKYQQFQQDFLAKAEASRAAIVQLAGIRSENEMAQLAQTDPAAWVAENQRQQSIYAVLNQMDQQISQERQRMQAQQEQMIQQQRAELYQKSWAELQKDGVDRDRLAKAYESASKTYGFSQEELGTILDHRQVRVMLDALAYRELKAQKPQVQQKVSAAPKMPNKSTTTAQRKADQQLEAKFRNGRAKLNDLASFLR